jgi:hypothetical protein
VISLELIKAYYDCAYPYKKYSDIKEDDKLLVISYDDRLKHKPPVVLYAIFDAYPCRSIRTCKKGCHTGGWVIGASPMLGSESNIMKTYGPIQYVCSNIVVDELGELYK